MDSTQQEYYDANTQPTKGTKSMTRQYITLPDPTPDAIRNAATKNPAGTWISYGNADLAQDMAQWELDRPKESVMQAVRDCEANGWIRSHQKRGVNGLSEYVFVLLPKIDTKHNT